MAKTREILNRINSITSTKKITQAMKMVSVSKLAKSQEKANSLSIYKSELDSIQKYIIDNIGSESDSPFIDGTLRTDTVKDQALAIVLSSDRGLCGSFNSNLFKACEVYFKELSQRHGAVKVLTIGKKGLGYFNKSKYEVIDSFTNALHNICFENTHELSGYLFDNYLKGEFSSIYLVYNQPEGKASNVIKREAFLPLDGLSADEENKDSQEKASSEDLIIYEPEKEQILDLLIPKLLKIKLYNALLNSVTAEHSARMMAMTKASDNADELLKELKLTYNRTRQAIITKELTEIVGGAEALKGGH